MPLSKARFPFRLFALAFAFSIIATLIAATLAWQIHTRVDQMVKKHITLTKNVGRIMLLDEELTMSARMAAATGDMDYERRYDQSDPQLTNLINEVRALLPQGEIGRCPELS